MCLFGGEGENNCFNNKIALIISLSIVLSALSGEAYKFSKATPPPEAAAQAPSPSPSPFSFTYTTYKNSPTPAPAPAYTPTNAPTEVEADADADDTAFYVVPTAELEGDVPKDKEAEDSKSLDLDVPKDEQVKDAKFLESNMKATVNKIEKFISTVVEKRLEDPKIEESDKQCLEQCQGVYENAIEAMQKSLEDVSSGDFFKANVDVSAFTTNIDTCDECFSEMIEPEFQKFNDWARGVASNCLDKIVEYSNTNYV
ncbi:UBX domain-containing protein 4-like [Olea europaea var. sylvestris]|uniref:UBX domain-containing protein 4-like n=1 Tax=Olea europaea var. sylvestris TaxID=158386 RepID=UPI000C1D48F7|nr:UBX domain-containing protein 4-like [Olea europaea var. sylvestris]